MYKSFCFQCSAESSVYMHSPWNSVVLKNKNSERWVSQVAFPLSAGLTRERVLASFPPALTFCPPRWNDHFFSWCIWAVPRQPRGFLSLATLQYSGSHADYLSSSGSYCCPMKFQCSKLLLEAQKENMRTLSPCLPSPGDWAVDTRVFCATKMSGIAWETMKRVTVQV